MGRVLGIIRDHWEAALFGLATPIWTIPGGTAPPP